MSDTLAVAAAFWGVLMAISPLLQMRRMIERRSSADFSLSFLVVLMVGFVLWVAYGLSIANLAIVVPNSVALVFALITFAVAYHYRAGSAN